MSAAIKWIIGLVVVAGLAWLLWWSGWLTTPKGGQGNNQAASTSTSTSTNPTPQTQPTNGMSGSGDISDAALTQDVSTVDTQMQGLAADSASVGASLSDTPVSQSY